MSEKKGLFGGLFGGKKQSGCCDMEIVEITEDAESCDCGGACSPAPVQEAPAECDCGGACCGDVSVESMEQAQAAQGQGPAVKVLGSGCKKCNELEANTKAALTQLGMDAEIDHVTDFSQIAAYGVMTTPALVVDGKVVAYGKVLKTDEVVKLLQKVRS